MACTCYSTPKVTYTTSRLRKTIGGAQTSSKGKIYYCFNHLMDIRQHLIWNAFKTYALALCVKGRP